MGDSLKLSGMYVVTEQNLLDFLQTDLGWITGEPSACALGSKSVVSSAAR